MRAKITLIIISCALIFMFASCGLPTPKLIDDAAAGAASLSSATLTDAAPADAGVTPASDSDASQTDASPAEPDPAVKINSVIEEVTEAIEETVEEIITTFTETSAETSESTTSSTTSSRVTRTVAERTHTSARTTTARNTHTTLVETTSAVSTVDNGFDGYTGRVEKVDKTYTSDLKCGVDMYRHVTIYYGFDENGKRYILKEEETGRTYDRRLYTAKYNDLLPAAKQNRQTYSAMINEILRLTNAMRAEKGIAPLKLDEKLTEQANVRSEEIAWSGRHSHTRPNLKSYSSLFIENGYTTGLSGENIGWYYPTAAEVCAAWKASPGHYENIMNPEFKKIGIGVAKECDPTKYYVYTQHFYG